MAQMNIRNKSDLHHEREHELLIFCSRPKLDLEHMERLETILQNPVDWPHILDLAESHGVRMLLYRTLRSIGSQCIPESVLNQLQTELQMRNNINIVLSYELLRILRLFEHHQILAVPFKGPVLAATAYGHIGMRMFSDLDIFIHQHDRNKVRDLLFSQGFQLVDEEDPDELEYYRDQQYHETFYNVENEFCLEIHWDIIARHFRYSPEFKILLKNIETTIFFNVSIPYLRLEDSLLLLCIHGMKHMWGRLIWICDIAELIQRAEKIDWDYLIGQADQIGSKRMLWLGLLLAHDLLGASIPESLKHLACSNRDVVVSAEQVHRDLFRNKSDLPTRKREKCMRQLCIRLKDHPQDKIRLFISILLHYMQPRRVDTKVLPLPSCLGFFYYIIRPIRIVGRLIERS